MPVKPDRVTTGAPTAMLLAATAASIPIGLVGYLLVGPPAALGAAIALALMLATAAFMWLADRFW